MATVTVSPGHFEDYSGIQFERLVFAYHVRMGWRGLVWYGQSGGDQGSDISGIEPFDDQPARKTIIQCANRGTLTLAKAKADMGKAAKAASGVRDVFKFVCRGAVSDASRTRIEQAATSLGVAHLTIWSGVEFEENLRLRAETCCIVSSKASSFLTPKQRSEGSWTTSPASRISMCCN
ncbi:hypothetical protein [Pigmentiphaga litoralis]|uniref:Restriction endonuclease type IV Mrr domain-containing protein n=1 Tax=Pigmentiphaga litoralis TaxID=516702 RepID=A0A7Y9LPN9_9BURK|nr:hypothetical protein [Pigmentiphaga litoralis]NYE22084.1 hypothetical protein [Pigmentiphaga litoralis]NYE84301.1 hypothetical protein [Pigmentiphaga litoralis]